MGSRGCPAEDRGDSGGPEIDPRDLVSDIGRKTAKRFGSSEYFMPPASIFVGSLMHRSAAQVTCEYQSASSSSTPAPWPKSSRNIVMSMSSENLEIRPNALERDVPPLNNNLGSAAAAPLINASRVQQTKKSFSTFYSSVPNRCAAARMKAPRRSSAPAARKVRKAAFIRAFLLDAWTAFPWMRRQLIYAPMVEESSASSPGGS